MTRNARRSGSDLPPEDKALVRRMRAGDEKAFEQFFEGYFHGLYRFALARLDHDSELAKELTQAAMCKAVEKLHTYRGEGPLFGWLCTFCRFEISAHFRRERRAPPRLQLIEDATEVRGALESIGFELNDPERQLLRRETARLVHTTLDHLPPRYSEILERKYSEGLSVKEIAEQFGISPKAVESLLGRARRAFRDGFSSLWDGLMEPDLKREK